MLNLTDDQKHDIRNRLQALEIVLDKMALELDNGDAWLEAWEIATKQFARLDGVIHDATTPDGSAPTG